MTSYLMFRRSVGIMTIGVMAVVITTACTSEPPPQPANLTQEKPETPISEGPSRMERVAMPKCKEGIDLRAQFKADTVRLNSFLSDCLDRVGKIGGSPTREACLSNRMGLFNQLREEREKLCNGGGGTL